MSIGASRFGLVLAAAGLMHASAAAEPARNVLVLFSNARLLPANVEAEAALRESLGRPEGRRADVYAEFLDAPNFGGESYVHTVVSYLREKYSPRPPNVIVAAGHDALVFLLNHREQLFPRAPIVHMGVSRERFRPMPSLPADVVGVPVEYDFTGTIDQALKWHPSARRLVVVTGAAGPDRVFEARLRDEVSGLGDRVKPEFLAALSTGAVLERLRRLGGDAIVFTPGYFQDGDGSVFTPRESVELMAGAAAAPVYGPFTTFMGTGVVGGRMASFETQARQAAGTVAALLAGAPPASLPLPNVAPTEVHIDWRQARRWGIRERDVPAGAVWHFRKPTIWEAHRTAVIAAAAVFMLQAGLIGALLGERRRRRRTVSALAESEKRMSLSAQAAELSLSGRKSAEMQAERDRAALLHMTRVSILGQLSASIAHQMNQPLAAILGNAEAAQKMLEMGQVDLLELRQICDDIVTEDLRAVEVIRRLRALYKRGELQLAPLDVNDLVNETLRFVRTDLLTRHVDPVADLAPSRPFIDGDRVQLQQVLLNLIMNAAEAMSGRGESDRTLTIRTESAGADVRISVADRGPGIAPDNLTRVFDPFWSTKQGGMGVGLAICQSIAAAHRGTLTASNNPDGGATFLASFPARGQG